LSTRVNLEDKNFLVKSYSFVALANLLTKPLWMLLFILAARVLGTEQFGIYSFANSTIGILNIFLDLGLDYIIIRESASDGSKTNSYFNGILLIRSFFTLFIILIILSYGIISGAFNSIQFFAILILFGFQSLTIILTFFKSVTTIYHNFKLFSGMMVFEKSMIIIIGFLVLYLSKLVLGFIGAIFFANILSTILFYYILNKKYSLHFSRINFSIITSLLKKALPFFILNIFIAIYFRIDILLLDYIIKDKSVVGIYGSIHRLIEMYLLIPTILMSISFPIITKKYSENKAFAIEFADRNLSFLLALSLFIACIVGFNSYFINKLLYGTAFAEGSNGLIYLIWVCIPISLNFVLGNLLVTVKKEKLSAFVVGLSCIINIALNIILIRKYSFVGTSIAALITEIFIFTAYSFLVVKHFGKIKIVSLSIKTIILISIVGLSSYFFNSYYGYHALMNILLTACLSILLMFILKIIRYRDLYEFFKKLRYN